MWSFKGFNFLKMKLVGTELDGRPSIVYISLVKCPRVSTLLSLQVTSFQYDIAERVCGSSEETQQNLQNDWRHRSEWKQFASHPLRHRSLQPLPSCSPSRGPADRQTDRPLSLYPPTRLKKTMQLLTQPFYFLIKWSAWLFYEGATLEREKKSEPSLWLDVSLLRVLAQ